VNALRYLRALVLRWQIWETEHWLRDCARDGLLHGRTLSEIRADLCRMRVRLALLQATPARPVHTHTTTAKGA
jgi:hypothetical protein